MKTRHEDFWELEGFLHSVLRTNQNGYGGIIRAESIEEHPMEAVILCIGALYRENEKNYRAVGDFLSFCHTIFDYPKENENYTSAQYVAAVKELVDVLLQK